MMHLTSVLPTFTHFTGIIEAINYTYIEAPAMCTLSDFVPVLYVAVYYTHTRIGILRHKFFFLSRLTPIRSHFLCVTLCISKCGRLPCRRIYILHIVHTRVYGMLLFLLPKYQNYKEHKITVINEITMTTTSSIHEIR